MGLQLLLIAIYIIITAIILDKPHKCPLWYICGVLWLVVTPYILAVILLVVSK